MTLLGILPFPLDVLNIRKKKKTTQLKFHFFNCWSFMGSARLTDINSVSQVRSYDLWALQTTRVNYLYGMFFVNAVNMTMFERTSSHSLKAHANGMFSHCDNVLIMVYDICNFYNMLISHGCLYSWNAVSQSWRSDLSEKVICNTCFNFGSLQVSSFRGTVWPSPAHLWRILAKTLAIWTKNKDVTALNYTP